MFRIKSLKQKFIIYYFENKILISKIKLKNSIIFLFDINFS